MDKFERFTSKALPLPVDNIDTDQIIPARFLRITHKEGLADALFAEWREQADFILNRPGSAGAKILVAGDNFGCGSSREHAPWALVAWGIRAVVSTRFADIFRNNALKNGLLPIAVDATTLSDIFARLEAAPDLALSVDLAAGRLHLPATATHAARDVSFDIEPFAKQCLLEGLDELGYILSHEGAIVAFESHHLV
jgi:3-isopropylmalate/(R)-2-methylmalate dehydratase small subunit